MTMILLRDATPDDHVAIVELNLADVTHTSAMDAARLAELAALSCWFRVACVDGEVQAFLLAMRRGAAYVNENFDWFSSRFADFIYVDRIVVSARARGRRLGSRLYEELFDEARRLGVETITCEYNVVPANEPSRRFHDAFGFSEQGRQWLANGSKQVSLQAASAHRFASGH